MDEWTRLTANRVFISDLGENQTTEIDGVKTEIGRFAVWAPVPKGNHNVVEVGSDVGRFDGTNTMCRPNGFCVC